MQNQYVDYEEVQAPKTPKTPTRRTTSKTPKKTPSGDRFIPTRSAMDLEISSFSLTKENSDPNAHLTPSKQDLKDQLADELFEGKMSKEAKILAFKTKAPAPKEGFQNVHRVLYSSNKVASNTGNQKFARHIPQQAEKILDAPHFVPDYYLNLIDWSSQNQLAICLGQTLYLWNATSAEITQLMAIPEEGNILTSVQWTKEGQHIAIGTNDGNVQIWDVENQKPLRNLRGHAARVGSLSWNDAILSSGSGDSTIHNHDVRIANHIVANLQGHEQEVCGLKWNEDGTQLASGGNDNVVNIWDVNQTTPKYRFTDHQAAVKALAWCPWQKDLLATGGGSSDRCIKFWNTNTGALLNSIDTQSQVSSLVWSKNPACREIVSSHGFSQNQITVWKYPSLAKVAELRGHDQRVLSLAMSPDGKTIASAAADETLRFWKVFDVEASQQVSQKVKQEASNAIAKAKCIR